MATRSNIIIRHKGSGLYFKVYCHYDGYPEAVGLMLKENYATYTRALNLVLMGDIKTLGPNLKKTTFYTRDNKEFAPPLIEQNSKPLDAGEEYVYIFENGEWETKKILIPREVDYKCL